ncbi:hypothetical protein MG293_000959 [Ovis ammon polii]|uniref:Uncharacterized protein n=1 Tax=Ovis ammon polii TaxID=230172 RepID=A0AAD4UQU4_OVIAM|nr:hypothetical protein MG293_000959 [Ovis ammon polii]
MQTLMTDGCPVGSACSSQHAELGPETARGDLPNPGIKPRSAALQEDSLPAEPQGKLENTGDEEPTHRKRPRWWESLKAGREGLNGITSQIDMSLSKLQEMVKDREAGHAAVHGVAKSSVLLNNNKDTNLIGLGPHPYDLGLPCGSDDKESAHSAGDPGSIPRSGRPPGEGNGNPLQYSC